MTVLLYTLGVVLFVLAILVSIGLHELGHMIPAKAFGGKVTQYFIGFGPTVWSRQVGETEYGIKSVPLGGYVKIVGMLPPAARELAEDLGVDEQGRPVQRVRKSNTGLFTQLISDARAAEWELVGPDDSGRLFYKMAWWKKVVVMAAGPSVNLVIAFLLFWIIFATYGQRESVVVDGPPVLAEVSDCAIPFEREDQTCGDGDPQSPAAAAGLRDGDRITAFNDTPVTDWYQLRELIQDNGDQEVDLQYERTGRTWTTTVDPTVDLRPTSPDDETLREVGFLGVVPVTRIDVTRGGPLFTLGEMGHMTVESAKAIGTLPLKVYDVGQAIVGVEERAADSPVSIVGGSRFAGEVSSDRDIDLGEKVAFLASLAGGFNLFIGLFNFVPLLPLDGGHIASALWEALRRGLARLRRRPDPGFVDAAKLLPVAYVVASVMLVMGVVLIVGDLVVPLSVTG